MTKSGKQHNACETIRQAAEDPTTTKSVITHNVVGKKKLVHYNDAMQKLIVKSEKFYFTHVAPYGQHQDLFNKDLQMPPAKQTKVSTDTRFPGRPRSL